MRHRTVAVCAATALTALTAAGCGSDSSDDSADSGPVKLTYWAWAPGLEEAAELWNESHPDIEVTVKEQAGGDELVTRTITAAKAGEAPDLMQAEYQALPTLVSNEVLSDVSEYAADSEGDFSPGVWQQVTLGTGAVYAMPQDSGPMMFFYREDLFDQYGLTVPATWEEFADTARELRDAEPDTYLTTFSANDAGHFAGLAQQAGAQWWTANGETWTVAIDDPASQRVADYWGGLVAEDVIDNKPMYTPAWNRALNTGEQIAWVGAVWAPSVLTTAAPDTEGKWAMAPLPQWEEGQNLTGSWGGSTTAVTQDCEYPEEAVEFMTWLNTDPEALAVMTENGIYPASTAAQTGDALSQPPAFFSNQPDFFTQAAQIAEGTQPAAWGPNVNVAYSAFNDAFGQAAKDRTDFGDALSQVQQATVDDMTEHGFQVSE